MVADHYSNDMACGPLQMAAANATTTMRVGSYVYNNDFRHPALLAKEAATIDVLSGGRLELGFGPATTRPNTTPWACRLTRRVFG
jgi:alkanesulfonate monooxygenase SsuD/methylene tetrahydromethanopterin reductase-like flavin-dependent oxidoreductase (luciferase family)